MEVHHHSHKPKNWKEYFVEFFMLFLAVSMGFVAENLRERQIENERSEELIHAFIVDIKENQKLLDSIIVYNQFQSNYFDSLSMEYAVKNDGVDLIGLAKSLDLWMHRFINRKAIFEQMKSSGALRYIRNSDLLKEILMYEEHAYLAEVRSMQSETDQYFDQFRPDLMKTLPPSFFIFQTANNQDTFRDSEVYPGFEKHYRKNETALTNDLSNTKLPKEKIRHLAAIWHHRAERLQVSLMSQIALRKEGDILLHHLETR